MCLACQAEDKEPGLDQLRNPNAPGHALQPSPPLSSRPNSFLMPERSFRAPVPPPARDTKVWATWGVHATLAFSQSFPLAVDIGVWGGGGGY